MNKNTDIINTVVNEHLNRMLEQERKNLELLPMPEFEFGQGCPFTSRDQMFEASLHMAVLMRVSIMARLN